LINLISIKLNYSIFRIFLYKILHLLKPKLLLITPPFTQLNTPYPATAYLKGFLNTKNYESFQMDLGIEVISSLFSKKGIEAIFTSVNNKNTTPFSENAQRILALKNTYCATIDVVTAF